MSVTKRQRVHLGDSRPTVAIDWPAGRPGTDPAVAVYHPRYQDDDTSVNPIASGTATRSSVNTTTSGAVAAGASSVPVTTRTGIAIGAKLWLVATSGFKEWFEVKDVTAGTGVTGTLTTVHPLANAFASGAAVQSAGCTYQLPLALDTLYWDDEGEYAEGWRVRWTVAGQAPEWTYFDFGLRSESFRYDVRDLLKLEPELMASEPLAQAGQRYQPQADAAVERMLVDLRIRGLDPDRVMGADELRELWREACLASLALMGVVHRRLDPLAASQIHESRYQRLLYDLVTARLRAGYDAGQSGVAGTRAGVTMLRARRY